MIIFYIELKTKEIKTAEKKIEEVEVKALVLTY